MDELIALFQRLAFIIYFSILNFIVIVLFCFATSLTRLELKSIGLRESNSHHHTHPGGIQGWVIKSIGGSKGKLGLDRIRVFIGILFAAVGGVVGSETLVLTKSG